MQQVLVTGGAGFIGSHLVEALLARGDTVSVLDDESTGRRANLDAVGDHPRLRYQRGSVADETLIRQLADEAEEIYHLAAAVGVQRVTADVLGTLQTNLYPTELLLSAAAARHQRGMPTKVFLASSSEVYGLNPKATWSEDDQLVFGPPSHRRWAYGLSKAVDEQFALAYHRQSGLPVVIGRLFNVVGPRQTGAYGMVLPRMVAAALAGEPLVVHGDGQQVRCFVHVTDVVAAITSLMGSAQAVGQVFNVGSDEPTTILALAEAVIAEVDRGLAVRHVTYTEVFGADFEDCRRRVPDLSRLRATIDFRPQYDLSEIIRQLVAEGRRQVG